MRLLLCFLLVGAARAGDLAWRRGPDDWYQARDFTLAEAPPAGVAPLKGEGVGYLRAGRLLLAASGVRLWVDRDLDGDLADEEAVAWRDLDEWLTALVKVGEVDYYVYRRAEGAGQRISITLIAHQEGEVVLEGRVRRVLLFDRNHDLRFDDAERDEIYLDRDGDGQVDRAPGSIERVVAGRPFRLRDAGYVAVLTGDGVRFERTGVVPPPPRRPWRGRAIPPAGVPATTPVAWRKALERQYRAWNAGRRPAGAKAGSPRGLLALIGATGSREAFAFLRRVYRTDRRVSRKAAAVAAMGHADYVAFASVVVAIARAGRHGPVRAAAVDALHRMDAPGRVPLFARRLRREREEAVVAALARNLAWTRTPAAREILRAAATTLPRATQRFHAYEALTRYSTEPPDAEIVLAAARDVDPRLRALALRDAWATGLVETRLLALEAARAERTSVELQLAVADLLGARGDPEAIGALLPLGAGADGAVRRRVLERLRPARDPASITALISGLQWRSPEVRALAAEILRDMPDPRVGPAVARRLEVEQEEPALTALVRAAGSHRARDAAVWIVAALRRDPANASLRAVGLSALGRIGFGQPVVAECFRELAASKVWEERVRALAAAGATGDPDAAGVLSERVADRVWQVRLAAVEGLGLARSKRSVPVLIDRLEREEMRRVRRAAAESLRRITGVNLYDIVSLWQRWWQENGEVFEVSDELPERKGEGGERRTVAAFFGIPVESDRVVFVIDRSGSMRDSPRPGAPSKYDRAVAETLAVADRLGAGARLNVILFDSRVRRWRKRLLKNTRSARAQLRDFLGRGGPGGGTNLYDALETALRMRGVETIYLLSDGAPTEGRYTVADDILRRVGTINAPRRIIVHSIAVGDHSALLADLARQNHGTYRLRGAEDATR